MSVFQFVFISKSPHSMKGAALHVLLHLHSQACNLYLKIIWCLDFLPLLSLHSGQKVKTNSKKWAIYKQVWFLRGAQKWADKTHWWRTFCVRGLFDSPLLFRVDVSGHQGGGWPWCAAPPPRYLYLYSCVCICISLICRSVKWELMIEEKGGLTFPPSCFY